MCQHCTLKEINQNRKKILLSSNSHNLLLIFDKTNQKNNHNSQLSRGVAKTISLPPNQRSKPGKCSVNRPLWLQSAKSPPPFHKHHYKCITQSINKQSKLHYSRDAPVDFPPFHHRFAEPGNRFSFRKTHSWFPRLTTIEWKSRPVGCTVAVKI